MDLLWGVFEKRLIDLSSEERVILSLVFLISACLVMIAFSLVVQVARKLEVKEDRPKSTNVLIRKGIGRVAQIDYRPEHARPAHTD